ncbi:MAG: PadR family transcriptional regulator [Alphaproteobacteria bacterium]|nr:MAG: PadR family transcriptional regulator [Alphaproteobacteria bacterium]
MKAEMLILGVLHRGDMHPYEIKRRLKAAHVESYLDVDVGTLYYAVKQLAGGGLIAEKGQETTGRTVRTIYGLTDAGRARMQQLIVETLGGQEGPKHPLYPALVFLHLADRQEAVALFSARITRLEQGITINEAVLRHIRDFTTGGMRLLMENSIAHMRTELDWTKKAIAELEAGEIFAGNEAAAPKHGFQEMMEKIAQQTESKKK